ncbi:MAG: hypothetical protein L6R38_001716 [Xanthoria sp. 2 TBL-2021]|nr:MAG: hypothetical protein L6R38_001716 [Xanthoria sp. 2 TBL-2021]
MTDPREILSTRASTFLLGKCTSRKPEKTTTTTNGWMQRVTRRIDTLSNDDHGDGVGQVYLLLQKIGIAALDAFLQSNVTGPPLQWDSAECIFPLDVANDPEMLRSIRQALIQDLSVDGEAVYQLIPNIELFCLAKCVLNHPASVAPKNVPGYLDCRWARVTVNFWHQKLLSENAASLQQIIYEDLDRVEQDLRNRSAEEDASRLVQQATIHTQHGLDQRARDALQQATVTTGLEFELTGRLGKRTKFQENELSQLVVLAKSADDKHQGTTPVRTDSIEETWGDLTTVTSKPDELNLNDDTLLESIAFSKPKADPLSANDSNISPSLAAIDPSDQPTLNPLDSIILLAYASSITNTSPSDGLTREETLPYATRVLQGSSTNWQIYTQALLVRSRIEGYRSRTIERGVLQLQALVDQVIVETTSNSSDTTSTAPSIQVQDDSGTSSFLPKPKPSESAPAQERLAYIHQLASPTRWELEAELASRWVSLGGLRTALEIYERLQMWAEVALCWAANDREDKARSILRRQLYTSAKPTEHPHQTMPTMDDDEVSVEDLTLERTPLPADAPRLFCILGDLERSPSMYEKAWEVSNHRYARAQRSLGKHYFSQGDLQKADDAYAKSLQVNALNHSTWFSLGCVRLQSESWAGAVDAFGRAIQIEDKDAESWSNMAAALIQLPAETNINGADVNPPTSTDHPAVDNDDDDISRTTKTDPQKHIRSAFIALKRAAALKRDSHRIWQNLLNVAVKLSPPPYSDIIIAQTRLIDLRSAVEGEKCIDIEVMERLLAHLIAISPSAGPPSTATDDEHENQINNASNGRPRMGFSKMLITLIQTKIVPLITTSRRLHLLVAKLSLHLHQPAAALEAYEKAWRCTLNTPGWDETNGEAEGSKWRDVVDATLELVDAYESLGERVKEGAEEGEVVEKGWRFKGRSAVRGVMGRGKEVWGGSEEFEMLRSRLEELKGF